MELLNTFKQVGQKRKTKLGLVLTLVVELAITYGLASWAVDNGNLFCWLAALIATIYCLKGLTELIGSFFNHGK